MTLAVLQLLKHVSVCLLDLASFS